MPWRHANYYNKSLVCENVLVFAQGGDLIRAKVCNQLHDM